MHKVPGFVRGHLLLPLLAAVLVALLSACASLAPDYSLEAYRNATTLKAESLALIAKAHEPYASHAREVEELSTRIDAAYEFSAGLPRNALSARQWAIMRSPDRNLYGGFVARWREQGRVGAFFRDEARSQIAEGFDYIICLEANKQKATACAVPTGVGS
ncbi:hypothetical protein [Lutibaculum baratangense]|uniref:Lipoprotein n=1 Tax=Lutibaculum baratangense AMV1 TaxID=631454 RepID=V4TL46_9HYPH|nr:hypothetical protein [Lutibaculum baratangense]ESR26543.1 hypothetical protein N177_0762 [Lutibaculum baratangense AMV1]